MFVMWEMERNGEYITMYERKYPAKCPVCNEYMKAVCETDAYHNSRFTESWGCMKCNKIYEDMDFDDCK